MVPSYWIKFLDEHQLRDAICEVTGNVDCSGFGGFQLDIYDEAECIMEATKVYPGIEAKEDGYIPIACGVETDALYFINGSDGESGPLYRIFCDGFPGKGDYKRESVHRVLKRYEDLLPYVTKRREG